MTANTGNSTTADTGSDVEDFLTVDFVGEGSPLSRLFSLCNVDQKAEFQPVRRSLRIHGHSTTIRLEQAFWTVLEVLSAEEGVSVAQLVTKIHDHCMGTNDKNLSSCLRVVCLKFINICT
ncbi:MAG: ribbon-helix-helix domain-containing protein [Rhodospirillaceae bacterium]|jgi:predicted DNA-binding ribbon-helix-helix protein|nr:ribbon-helix-helix domain-containing protein [Rhodospirillaceae bacterium]MBT4464826.1 ribbon-helix-helix domain-containing protein [Rhodospirillaceae bacterium]MBT5308078.1 ribbon-helix-helix domain-containing protein [Rhodospirillaceae bacterium]MBT7357205.1 ribbon-helix-helix domain-containing protein [Rhodospirillaceae bacterium]